MKLQDLVETPKIIKGSVVVPTETTELNYKGVTVRGDFNAGRTRITSLKGSPAIVMGDFYCYNTPITSLDGAPRTVHGDFICLETRITSLHNVHKQTIEFIFGRLMLPGTIKSHVLGLMFIKGLKAIIFDSEVGTVFEHKEHRQVEAIINKHLPGGNVHQCQEELLEAGLGEYAKL